MIRLSVCNIHVFLTCGGFNEYIIIINNNNKGFLNSRNVNNATGLTKPYVVTTYKIYKIQIE